MAKTILVADDEPNIARLVQMSLERNGYTVVLAPDGREALKQVADSRPDLILLDVMMPHVDGFEVLEKLKGDPATRDIPVIMMTVKARDADTFEATERGAAAFLWKPVNPSDLLATVDLVLRAPRA
jgi:CheY-like chemotaxis protein